MARSWLKVTLQELNLAFTLPSGQCFRWKKRSAASSDGNDVWVGVLGSRVLQVEQDVSGNRLFYEQLNGSDNVINGPNKKMKTSLEDTLSDYFQLDTSLSTLYKSWSASDDLFKRVSSSFPGVRVLRQDPTECLFSFICSSCNNIKRITQMINNICLKYGRLLHEDTEFGPIHSFPSIESLADPNVEQELRTLGFGYRAKFIQSTAKQIIDQKMDLMTLRSLSYEESHSVLLKLPGIGAKVADCICLFCLDKGNAIPVDTHVYAIATRDYNVSKVGKSKTVTSKSYKLIGDFFRSKFESNAGWAHSVLFAADLNMFRDIKAKV